MDSTFHYVPHLLFCQLKAEPHYPGFPKRTANFVVCTEWAIVNRDYTSPRQCVKEIIRRCYIGRPSFSAFLRCFRPIFYNILPKFDGSRFTALAVLFINYTDASTRSISCPILVWAVPLSVPHGRTGVLRRCPVESSLCRVRGWRAGLQGHCYDSWRYRLADLR
jgi:hypothetical protein